MGCKEGYFSINQECTKCSGNPASSGAWVVGAAITTILLCAGLALFFQAPCWLGSIAIAVDFLQILARFVDFRLNWPTKVKSLFDSASLLNMNFHFLQLECFAEPDYVSEFVFSMFIPSFALGGFGVCYLLVLLWDKTISKFELRGKYKDG